MIFFEYEQVVKLHSSLIKKTGGLDGVRDENLLDSTLKSPFQTFEGNDLYPEILDKAAQLCYSLINLLYLQQELIDFGFSIASGKMPKDDIKKWFIEHKK